MKRVTSLLSVRRNSWAVKSAAGIAALSVVGMSIAAGAGASAATASGADLTTLLSAATAASGSASPSPSSTAPPAGTVDPEATATGPQVVVGKAVAVTTNAAGEPIDQGYYAATNVSGSGTSTVNVPMGPNKPVDLTSFRQLTTEGDSVIYNVNTSGSDVKTMVASGGEYKAELPVTITTELLVNGKPVDPNTATKITGDVNLTYNFHNNTATKESISYVDATGATQKMEVAIAVPMTLSYDGSFGNGWANIVAPWANSGFSPTQTVTGGSSIGPSALNGWNPDGKLTITAIADNATLPSAVINVIPKSASGEVTSIEGKVAAGGTTVSELLTNKAVPLLMEVENGLAKASTTISTALNDKVDPILDLVAKLKLNPQKADKIIAAGGKDIAAAADMFLAINGATEQAAAELATVVNRLTSPATAAKINDLAGQVDSIEPILALIIDDVIPEVITQITDASEKLAIAPGSYICQSFLGLPADCTAATIIDSLFLPLLPSSCTAQHDMFVAWSNNPTWNTSLTTAINASSGATAANLTTLQANLVAQAAAGDVDPGCMQAATDVANDIEGLLPAIGQLIPIIDGFIPLLKDVQKLLPDVATALDELSAAMPAINTAVDSPCGATSVSDNLQGCGLLQVMTLVSAANGQAATQINGEIAGLVKVITPAVNKLYKIADIIVAAAKPLEKQLAELPKVINELAYNNIGPLVSGVEGLTGMATKLTDVASQSAAVNAAIDTKFSTGEGFPYGAATGTGVGTQAIYQFSVAAAETGVASKGTTIAFAIVLLLLAIAGGAWAEMRRRSHA